MLTESDKYYLAGLLDRAPVSDILQALTTVAREEADRLHRTVTALLTAHSNELFGQAVTARDHAERRVNVLAKATQEATAQELHLGSPATAHWVTANQPAQMAFL